MSLQSIKKLISNINFDGGVLIIFIMGLIGLTTMIIIDYSTPIQQYYKVQLEQLCSERVTMLNMTDTSIAIKCGKLSINLTFK